MIEMIDSQTMNTLMTLSHSVSLLYFLKLMTQNVYWCPTRFTFITIFVSFSCNGSGSTNGAGTAYPSSAPIFVQSLVFGVVFCLSCFVFSPLYCLYFIKLVDLIIL
jgi:hypothetical protein